MTQLRTPGVAVLLVLCALAGPAAAQQAPSDEGDTVVDWYFYDVGNVPEGKLTSIPLSSHRTTRHHNFPAFPGPWLDFPFEETQKQTVYHGAASPGQQCYHESMESPGQCAPLEHCQWAQREVRRTGQTQFCGPDIRLVCCPSATDKVHYPHYQLPYEIAPQPPCNCGQHQHKVPDCHGEPQDHGQGHAKPLDPYYPGPQYPHGQGPFGQYYPPPYETQKPYGPPQGHVMPPAGHHNLAPLEPLPSPALGMPSGGDFGIDQDAWMPPQKPKPVPSRPSGFDAGRVPPVYLSPGITENEFMDKRNATTSEPSGLVEPIDLRRQRGAIARKMCVEYEKYAPKVRYGPDKDCIPNHTYPIGGNPALPTEFPHMAQLGVGSRNSIQYFCGGALIAPTWVMTAAHCVFRDSNSVQWVRLGDQVPDSETDDSFPQIIEVVESITHPNYTAREVYNDVALLRLRHAPNMTTPHVRPACLQIDKELQKDKLNLIGFGLTEENGFPAKELMEVALWRTPYEKCEKFFRGEVNLRQLPQGLDDDSQLCAGLDQVGKDACQGDSGGPLNTPYSPTCMHSVAGITSFGQGCGRGKPGVYTRVSHFVPWIENIVWADQM